MNAATRRPWHAPQAQEHGAFASVTRQPLTCPGGGTVKNGNNLDGLSFNSQDLACSFP
jgi:hypothetical protein